MSQSHSKSNPRRNGASARPAWRRRITLNTAFAQRVYKRTFDRMKADLFVLTVRTCAQGQNEAAAAAEQFLEEQFGKVREDLNGELERAEVLMDHAGIDSMPVYEEALATEAEITTPNAGQYLSLIESLDQFLMRLDALWLTGKVETKHRTARSHEWQRRLIKLAGRVRDLGDRTRKFLSTQVQPKTEELAEVGERAESEEQPEQLEQSEQPEQPELSEQPEPSETAPEPTAATTE